VLSEKAFSIFYSATRDVDGTKFEYCHLCGWLPKNMIKAAHLVPKSLVGGELSYLFGEGEVVLMNLRNGNVCFCYLN
jgi:hypothetical protein